MKFYFSTRIFQNKWKFPSCNWQSMTFIFNLYSDNYIPSRLQLQRLWRQPLLYAVLLSIIFKSLKKGASKVEPIIQFTNGGWSFYKEFQPNFCKWLAAWRLIFLHHIMQLDGRGGSLGAWGLLLPCGKKFVYFFKLMRNKYHIKCFKAVVPNLWYAHPRG